MKHKCSTGLMMKYNKDSTKRIQPMLARLDKSTHDSIEISVDHSIEKQHINKNSYIYIL